VEIWNPPEARGTLYDAKNEPGRLKHRHAKQRAVRLRPKPTLAAAARLPAKQRPAPENLRANAPDMSGIPRQITPEGNVLRVSSGHASVQLTR
jgi:hypothetical protein